MCLHPSVWLSVPMRKSRTVKSFNHAVKRPSISITWWLRSQWSLCSSLSPSSTWLESVVFWSSHPDMPCLSEWVALVVSLWLVFLLRWETMRSIKWRSRRTIACKSGVMIWKIFWECVAEKDSPHLSFSQILRLRKKVSLKMLITFWTQVKFLTSSPLMKRLIYAS